MKTILIFIGLFFSVVSYGQISLDTVNTGTAPGSGDGEVMYTAFQKTNAAIKVLNNSVSLDSIIVNYFTGVLTDGAPTSAEITAILGIPSAIGAGYTARIKDSNGSGLVYYIVSDGTSWYWTTSTLAL